MVTKVLADNTASISEFKKNPMKTVREGGGFPIAILNRNEPAFYCVTAEVWEEILEKLDDLYLAEIVSERINGPFIDIDLDAL